MAAQRPPTASSPSPPEKAISASSSANSDSLLMSMRQPVSSRREPGVLALAADRERELVVRHDHRRLLVLVVDEHLADARRRERLGDEAGGLVVPRDDVDLLAAQLGHDHAHAAAARADAGADGIDALGARLDRDLGAVAGLAGDRADHDEAVSISGTSSSNSSRISSSERRESTICGPLVPERTSMMTALMRAPCS